MKNKKSLQNFTTHFNEVIQLIDKARHAALKSVNSELINLYWKIGEYIHNKLSTSEWGESVVSELASHIQKNYPRYKGYSDKNLWRMKQFYVVYKDSNLSAMLREISWTNNLFILSKSKTAEEREFYLKLSIKEKYTSRELERQINSGFYERSVMPNKKISPLMRELATETVFKDTYILNFLDLPEFFDEKDLRKSIVKNFKSFVGIKVIWHLM